VGPAPPYGRPKRPPPSWTPRIHRSPGRAGITSESAGVWRRLGACRARHCARTTFRHRGTIHTMALPGNPRGRTIRCICASSEVGRRRAIGGVAVLQLFTERPRRWCDVGPPEADQKAGVPGSRTARTLSATVPTWKSSCPSWPGIAGWPDVPWTDWPQGINALPTALKDQGQTQPLMPSAILPTGRSSRPSSSGSTGKLHTPNTGWPQGMNALPTALKDQGGPQGMNALPTALKNRGSWSAAVHRSRGTVE